MLEFRGLASLVVLFCVATTAWSDTLRMSNGGDTFISGGAVTETVDSIGDTFFVGRTVAAHGASSGDLHVTGFDISVSTDAAEDLYAFGATVVVRGNVAHDLTAAGFSVRTESTSKTRGNARLLGGSITIEGPVDGAITVTGGDVILNAAISGDARIVAGTLSFGSDAMVGGSLTYASDQEIDVPERVAPPERVSFERVSPFDAWEEIDRIRKDMPILPTFFSLFSGFIISLLFFLALAAIMLGFMPDRLERMRKRIADSPGQTILLGILGLSILFGLVPICALTIVGLPVVPAAVLAILVAWVLGYALGAYSVAMRLWTGSGGAEDPSNVARLMVFAAAIVFVAALNFIPFFGWVVNYTLVLLGIGSMTTAMLAWALGRPVRALDADMKPMEE